MELGVSTLGHNIEYGLTGRYNNLIDFLLESTKACLEFAEKNGIKVVEVIIDPSDIFTSENRKNYIDLCKSYNLKYQVHGPFVDVSMCSHNLHISKASVNSYIETVKVCDEINASVITIHPGVANFLIKAIKGFNNKRLIEAVNSLLNAVGNANVIVCIENMPKSTNILLNIDDIGKFLQELNRDDIFLTYDTSHFYTNNGNVELFWSKFHNIIKNVHVVDNFTTESDTHPALGSGKINFKEIIGIIKRYKYNSALIIELASAKDLPKSVEYIKKCI